MEKLLSSENDNRQPINSVAVFDFDHTLIEHDSFWPFMGFVAGWPQTMAALAEGCALFALRRLKDKTDPVLADHRTFIKAHLLRRLLAGRSVHQLAPAIGRLQGWTRWKEPVRKALLDHHAEGHRIVIASGGLDLYLPELLKELPPHTLVCTQVEVKDGVIAGGMISGNCVRHRKAELVAGYIAQHGPFAESWGYGNIPHDLPMLNLLKHRIIV